MINFNISNNIMTYIGIKIFNKRRVLHLDIMLKINALPSPRIQIKPFLRRYLWSKYASIRKARTRFRTLEKIHIILIILKYLAVMSLTQIFFRWRSIFLPYLPRNATLNSSFFLIPGLPSYLGPHVLSHPIICIGRSVSCIYFFIISPEQVHILS